MNKLIGVSHTPEELEDVIKLLSESDFSSAGLELPEDYAKRFEEEGYRVGYFGDLAEHFKKRGITTFFLEDSKLWDRIQVIDKARYNGEEKVRQRLAGLQGTLNDFYTPPEATIGLKQEIARYQEVLKLLADRPSPEQLTNLFEECNEARESYVLSRILTTKPEVCIIGDGHARKIRHSLPTYEYISLVEARK